MAALSVCAMPAVAGPEWVEGIAGDAGNIPSGAQRTIGDGTLLEIHGALDGALGPGSNDTEDMFAIQITEPGIFVASTASNGGNSAFQSRLWLFDEDGHPLLGNQLDPGDESGGSSSGATLGNAATDNTGVVITEPGIYLVCVSLAPRNPTSGGEFMYDFERFTEVSGPDGVGGSGIVDGWEGDGDAFTTGPAIGPALPPDSPAGINYIIALQGVGFAAPPPAGQDRTSATEKGSLVLLSKVDIRWDAAGFLTQDTFISLANDFPEDVKVQMYFVNGDPPLEADGAERAHPGWNWVDNEIEPTMNEPTCWSAVTGLPEGVSPFASALDPGFPPGRPDPETGGRMMRGFIYAWAVNSDGEEIRWNHLAGKACIINYALATAWEYLGWSFQVVDAGVSHGDPTGTPGVLNLDGLEYARPFDQLLFQFQAVGSNAFAGPRLVTSNTDLTVHPVSADLRQETDGPITTKAHFDVWNNNEVKFSGAYRCVTCWDQELLGNYGTPNHFTLANLQTDCGKARIDGLASQLCDLDFDPANNDDFPFPPGPGDNIDPRDIVSEPAALLALVAKQLIFDTVGPDRAWAGTNVTGMGLESAAIEYDVLGAPPEATAPTTEAWLDDVVESALKKRAGK
jgi:hypothetical protein